MATGFRPGGPNVIPPNAPEGFPETYDADELTSYELGLRADSPGGAAPLFAEVAAALHGSGASLTTHVYGLGGRDLHPEDVARIFSGEAERYVGLRGEPCPV